MKTAQSKNLKSLVTKFEVFGSLPLSERLQSQEAPAEGTIDAPRCSLEEEDILEIYRERQKDKNS